MRNTICIATFMLFCSGNVVGQLPYKVGPPCSKCASGKGWCYKNLCSKYTVMRASRRDATVNRENEVGYWRKREENLSIDEMIEITPGYHLHNKIQD